MSVRLRLAPSPTGFLHIGTLRLALWNYLYVKQQGGSFVLRIEDTDQTRQVEGAEEAIYEALAWVGITLDESPRAGGPYAPYTQSERARRHKEVAERLVSEGKAYRCYCTRERLAALREQQEKQGLPPTYDRRCRTLSQDEQEALEQAGTPSTIRFKMPLDGLILSEDMVRGTLRAPAKDQDDAILFKSDGQATYHLAAMVDDYDMGITHVLRGEEWLPSFPKHTEIIKACGFPMPQFIHTSLILNEDRTKLSKRKGPVAVHNFRQEGYLPDALLNFLILLGWSPKETNKELFTSMEEMVDHFDLTRISTAPAVFKREKLDWLNGVYIRGRTLEALEGDLIAYLTYMGEGRRDGETYHFPTLNWTVDRSRFLLMLEQAQSKMLTLKEFVPGLSVYREVADHTADLYLHPKMKVDLPTAKRGLQLAEEQLTELTSWDMETIKTTLLGTIADAELKNGQVLWPLRVALTGVSASPGAFEMAHILGKDETLRRLQAARVLLG